MVFPPLSHNLEPEKKKIYADLYSWPQLQLLWYYIYTILNTYFYLPQLSLFNGCCSSSNQMILMIRQKWRLRCCFARCSLITFPLNIFGSTMQKGLRSEEHTSELQSPVPISYAVFCLKKKKKTKKKKHTHTHTHHTLLKYHSHVPSFVPSQHLT